MDKIMKFIGFLKSRFGATVMSSDEAKNWVEPNEKLCVGLTLPDTSKSFMAISAGDFDLMLKSEKDHLIQEYDSPYPNLKAILYEAANGNLDMRMIDGYAGVIRMLFAFLTESE